MPVTFTAGNRIAIWRERSGYTDRSQSSLVWKTTTVGLVPGPDMNTEPLATKCGATPNRFVRTYPISISRVLIISRNSFKRYMVKTSEAHAQ